MSYHAGAGKLRQKKTVNARLLNGLLGEVRGHNKVRRLRPHDPPPAFLSPDLWPTGSSVPGYTAASKDVGSRQSATWARQL